MSEAGDLANTLNKIFTNRSFLQSLVMSDEELYEKKGININQYACKLATVLKYYIATRDTDANLTYDEISRRYSEIKYSEGELPYGASEKNVNENGFLTHSFNGNKKIRIKKHGLGYTETMSEEEKKQVEEMRSNLNRLEEILGKSQFLSNYGGGERARDELFLARPGETTMWYALQNSPERLYEGPLKYALNLPVVLGETKAQYIFRCLENKIIKKYSDVNSQEYKEAVKVARKVADDYCSQSPAFALISWEQIVNEQILIQEGKISEEDFDRWKQNSDKSKYKLPHGLSYRKWEDCFSDRFAGDCNDNWTTLSRFKMFQDKKSIGIVDVVEPFELSQLYAKKLGLQEGDKIMANGQPCRKDFSIDELIELIRTENMPSKLEIFEKKLEKMKKDNSRQLHSAENEIQSKYGTLDVQALREKLSILEQTQNEILDRSFIHKENAKDTGTHGYIDKYKYSLRTIIDDIKKSDNMELLLEADSGIENDDLQYDSNIHGASHTRRVNFWAMAIMTERKTSPRTMELVLLAVKNHDIGRINDLEDKEHGANSADILEKNDDRISGLSDQEKKLVEFAIKQHSLSKKENEKAILELPKDLQKKYREVLEILKDADKLDRVRLDPRGLNHVEGLDVSRLSNKRYECFELSAYEALDKLTEVLGIEKQIQEIDQFLNTIYEKSKFPECEELLEMQKENCKKNSGMFLKGFIDKSRERFGLNQIKSFILKLKEKFEQKSEVKGPTGRS